MVKKRGNRSTIPKKSTLVVGASYWKRIFAFVIDLLIIQLIVMRPFESVFTQVFGETGTYDAAVKYLETNPAVLGELSWVITLVGILMILYFAVMQYRYKQTLGMMLFGIWIHTEKKELKLWQVFVSNLMLMPVFPFALLWVIDPVYAVFSQSGQRFTQKLVEIYVIEEREVAYLP